MFEISGRPVVSLADAVIFLSALKRPEEQRRQAGVFFEGTRHAVASGCFSRTENLLERRAAHDLPDLFQILRQADFSAIRRLHGPIAAEDFQCRTDAGKYEISAAHAFALQVLHPVGDTQGQFPEHIGPLADGSIVLTRAANQMNAGGQGGRVACA